MTQTKPKNKLWRQPWLLYLLVVICGVVLVKVIDINIYPYKLLTQEWYSPDNSALKNIVFIGWIIRKLNLFQTELLALFLYVIIQFFELLPKLIESDRDLVRKLLASASNFSQPTNNDKGTIRRLKRALQPIALVFKAYADSLRVLAYVIDAFVCYAGYPFFEGVSRLYEVDKIFDLIVFGQFDKILWDKVILFALTVYGVEFLLKAILGIFSLIYLKLQP